MISAVEEEMLRMEAEIAQHRNASLLLICLSGRTGTYQQYNRAYHVDFGVRFPATEIYL